MATPLICQSCLSENAPSSRFCASCGSALSPAGDTDTTLKVVTVLFVDMADSTALGEELDPEALSAVLGRYFEHLRSTIERHGGTVQKFAGDAVLSVFGIPRVHEDDPLRAVRAAVEIHSELPPIANEVGVAIALRTGVNTGRVITDYGKNLALGDAVNVAARLQQCAQPGEILLGEQTLRLVRDAVKAEPLEPLTLKGKTLPVQAFRLLEIDRTAPALARRLDLPLVDRTEELALLREAWNRAVTESRCQLVTMTGAAGVGKSRLAEELFRTLSPEATVLRGRCLHYGEGITFWPMVEALGGAGERAAPVRAHLSEGGAGTPEELFLEVRRLLEAMAREQPLILYVDDIQWAEPMLMELLGHIAQLSTDAPLMILCTARPELLEEHAQWGAGSSKISLDALVPSETERLIDQLGPDLDPDARAYVIRTSEGNPLFAEEMVMLAREGGIEEVPMTIQSLLTARIERLAPAQRELLARGSIEGQVFHRSAVTSLTDESTGPDADAQLRDLIRKDLIRPHRTDLSGDEAYTFRHLLIRDVAYERLPRARRAQLHERFAGWLEERAQDVPEHEELAGWHLEQAIHDRERARGKVDAEIMRRAASHLRSAARRAADRGDMVASRKLLERALALAAGEDALRVELTAALAERMIELGDLSQADELLVEAERWRAGDPALALCRLLWMFHVRPQEAPEVYTRTAERVLAQLAETGNERGLANMHELGFWMHWTASRATAAGQEARLAAEHAAAAGENALRSRALGWYVATLVFGPAHARAMGDELDRLEAENPGPYLQAFIDLGRGDVHRLDGDFEAAVDLTLRSREGFRSLGIATMAATCEQTLGWIELGRGDAQRAHEALQRSDAILAEFGESTIRSTTQAMLARAEQTLGHVERARRAIEHAEALSSPIDLLNFTITDGVRAEVARAAGDLEGAERSARDSIRHADGTDFVSYQARGRLLLASVLVDAGRRPEALLAAREASALYKAKGEQAGIRSAQELLDRIG